MQSIRRTAGGTNVVCMASHGETYIWLFRDDRVAECLRTLGKYAADERLSFTWYDAARVSQAVRDVANESRRARS